MLDHKCIGSVSVLCLFSGYVPVVCYKEGIPILGNLLSCLHKDLVVVEDVKFRCNMNFYMPLELLQGI